MHVLQDHLPNAPWMAEATRRLPGLQPLAGLHDWLPRDGAFAGQMALRDRLVTERRGDVIAACDGSDAAVQELYEEVLGYLRGQDGYGWEGGSCRRPDGVLIPLDEGRPLDTLSRLVQQDLCLLERPDASQEHRLSAAVLCFPASWTLVEKIGRPMTVIHGPVPDYDSMMAKRVQRVFDNLRCETPVWRQNAMTYADADLYHPRREDDPREARGGAYVRSERQVLRRLPRTGAIVFSIHTHVVRIADLTAEQRAGMTDVAGLD